MKKKRNILFIGQSGAGKTSLINLILNSEELQMSKFNPDFKYTWKWHPEEKHKDVGSSLTQSCSYIDYCFESRHLTLIDTPGIGDTEGVEKDNANISQIFKHLENYDEFHSILLVYSFDQKMSLRTKRMFLTFLQWIPQDMHKNLTVVCPKCSDDADVAHESLKKLNLDIPKENIITIDNHIGNWLRGKNKKKIASVATEDAFDTISKVVKSDTSSAIKYKNINDNRVTLDQLYGNIILLSKKILGYEVRNTTMKEDEISKKPNTKPPIKVKQYSTLKENKQVIVTKYEEKNYYSTVCLICGNDCHEHCYVFPNVNKCIVNDSKGILCTVCKHTMNQHIHRKGKIEKIESIKLDKSNEKIQQQTQEVLDNFNLDEPEDHNTLNKNIMKLKQFINYELFKDYLEALISETLWDYQTLPIDKLQKKKTLQYVCPLLVVYKLCDMKNPNIDDEIKKDKINSIYDGSLWNVMKVLNDKKYKILIDHYN